MIAVQERQQYYVLGPNQDSRLASVAPGAVVKGVKLVMDPDAPFVLRSRAVYCQYLDTNSGTQKELSQLRTRWTGPTKDYRSQGWVSEACQMAYFGQFGNPKPVGPIEYPANGVLLLDLYNASATYTITNLTFLWGGVKLFPPGTVPAYRWPKGAAVEPFNYQLCASGGFTLAAGPVTTSPQVFQMKTDGDMVIRGIQATWRTSAGAVLSEGSNIGFKLLDFNRKPYMNDYVRLDVMAGFAPSTVADVSASVFPVGTTPSLIAPIGAGPCAPGLFFPEIYIPKNHQLMYVLTRDDSKIAAAPSVNVTVNLLGTKVFAQ